MVLSFHFFDICRWLYSLHAQSCFEECSGLVCASSLVVSDLLLAKARGIGLNLRQILLVLGLDPRLRLFVDLLCSSPASRFSAPVHQVPVSGNPAYPAPVLLGSL
ncbi:uncharacterized protein METZ01_LOCUS156356 [marine metagenome]|uniref:Uncharacterized protein n=1 Tax=marine metagenome TaxID=408172 RepID=A0A382AQY2_9ZZZZ